MMMLFQREATRGVVLQVEQFDDVCSNLRDAVARRNHLAFLDHEQLPFAGDEGGANGTVGAGILGNTGELERRLCERRRCELGERRIDPIDLQP